MYVAFILNLFIFSYLRLWLRLSQAKARPELTWMAWPEVFKSQSDLKPSQSLGLRPKLGRKNTI
jgi:hypothetical protein